jgi:uncharacterized protein (TIGR02246 family)
MTEDRIEDFLDRFCAAWRSNDAGAFAALFIEDATYVTWQGVWLRGRDEIERECDAFFGQGAVAPMHLRLLNVRALGPAVRLVVTMGAGQTQTFTLILRGGSWVCAALHNTAVGLRVLDGARPALTY